MEYDHQVENVYLTVVNDRRMYELCESYIHESKPLFIGDIDALLWNVENYKKLSPTKRKQVWNTIAFHIDENAMARVFKSQLQNYENTLIKVTELQSPIKQEEKEMAATTEQVKQKAFEQISYVFGKNIEDLSAPELLSAAKKVKSEINDLKSAGIESTYVSSEIAKLEEAQVKIVEKLDTFV